MMINLDRAMNRVDEPPLGSAERTRRSQITPSQLGAFRFCLRHYLRLSLLAIERVCLQQLVHQQTGAYPPPKPREVEEILGQEWRLAAASLVVLVKVRTVAMHIFQDFTMGQWTAGVQERAHPVRHRTKHSSTTPHRLETKSSLGQRNPIQHPTHQYLHHT